MMRFLPVAVSALLLLAGGPAFAQAGERLFNQQCKNCHAVEKGDTNGTGPNLSGVFGRKAGTSEPAKTSDAMKGSGIVWDEATLAEYLKDPKARVPNGTMNFNGLKQPKQVADVVAYLKEVTK